MKALVAEDDRISRRILSATLEKWGYEVIVTVDGKEALDVLLQPEPPRLAVLDWMMPEMDGVDVCRRLRQIPTDSPPYIILLTARGEKDDIVEGLEAGANDYLAKPYDPQELRARVNIGRRMVEIQQQLVDRVNDLQNARQRLAEARDREIQIAGRIQKSLLIGRPPGSVNGLQIAATTIPSKQVDGDFYDFFPLSDESMDIVIGDVMGKGVPAALLGAGTKGNILRVLNGLLPAAQGADLPRPREIVGALHASMVRELMDLDSFLTLCYVRIRRREGRLLCVDCGHTGILHWRAAEKCWRTVRGTNMPMGFSSREAYQEVEEDLAPKDLLVFFSDGITEAKRADGTMFGEERLAATIRPYANRPVSDILEKIQEAVVEFTDASALTDDLTCIVVRVDEDRQENRLAVKDITLPAKIDRLRELRAALTEFCDQAELAGMTEQACSLLLLATQELASNIIEHAYQDREDGTLHIRMEAFADAVRVTLTHEGDAFVATRPAMPSPEDAQPHGYGLFMIDAAVDGCSYGTDEQGNNYVSVLKLIGGAEEEQP